MALFDREKRGGAPAELYWFRFGTTTYGVYTSQDIARTAVIPAAVSLSGGEIVQDFTPLAITHDARNAGENTTDQNVKITLPAASAVGAMYIGQRPLFTLTVGIYRVHRGDADARRMFFGDVTGVSVVAGQVVLDCTPRSAAIKRPMLRVLYQAPCNNNLYDAICGVDPDAFATAGTVGAIAADGVTLTISAASGQPDGYYTAGMLKFGSEYGFIRSHVGSTVVLIRAVPALAVASSVTIYAGCDRSLQTCTDKFANTANHLGFPFVPSTNPFTDGLAD